MLKQLQNTSISALPTNTLKDQNEVLLESKDTKEGNTSNTSESTETAVSSRNAASAKSPKTDSNSSDISVAASSMVCSESAALGSSPARVLTDQPSSTDAARTAVTTTFVDNKTSRSSSLTDEDEKDLSEIDIIRALPRSRKIELVLKIKRPDEKNSETPNFRLKPIRAEQGHWVAFDPTIMTSGLSSSIGVGPKDTEGVGSQEAGPCLIVILNDPKTFTIAVHIEPQSDPSFLNIFLDSMSSEVVAHLKGGNLFGEPGLFGSAEKPGISINLETYWLLKKRNIPIKTIDIGNGKPNGYSPDDSRSIAIKLSNGKVYSPYENFIRYPHFSNQKIEDVYAIKKFIEEHKARRKLEPTDISMPSATAVTRTSPLPDERIATRAMINFSANTNVTGERRKDSHDAVPVDSSGANVAPVNEANNANTGQSTNSSAPSYQPGL